MIPTACAAAARTAAINAVQENRGRQSRFLWGRHPGMRNARLAALLRIHLLSVSHAPDSLFVISAARSGYEPWGSCGTPG